jgi:hypothetical protein
LINSTGRIIEKGIHLGLINVTARKPVSPADQVVMTKSPAALPSSIFYGKQVENYFPAVEVTAPNPGRYTNAE